MRVADRFGFLREVNTVKRRRGGSFGIAGLMSVMAPPHRDRVSDRLTGIGPWEL